MNAATKIQLLSSVQQQINQSTIRFSGKSVFSLLFYLTLETQRTESTFRSPLSILHYGHSIILTGLSSAYQRPFKEHLVVKQSSYLFLNALLRFIPPIQLASTCLFCHIIQQSIQVQGTSVPESAQRFEDYYDNCGQK